MRVDEQLVFGAYRITVRCNECVRQIRVYVLGGDRTPDSIEDALTNVGWTTNDADEHYCTEHAE